MVQHSLCDNILISIHALREEGDAVFPLKSAMTFYFYPRPPRGGRRGSASLIASVVTISIHALREEGDVVLNVNARRQHKFLSTPSARRATMRLKSLIGIASNFYPRPPRGGRPAVPRFHGGRSEISIHALREEGDPRRRREGKQNRRFLSTPSARRATSPTRPPRALLSDFYPRPPRGGRLGTVTAKSWRVSYFYPRPPRGGRLAVHVLCFLPCGFLSTPSARRATSRNVQGFRVRTISIHALREEGDFPGSMYYVGTYGFLSTPSARRATGRCYSSITSTTFLSTPSARRATPARRGRAPDECISIHALREEGDWQRCRPICLP